MTFLRRRPSVDHRGWTAPPKPIFGRRGIAALLLVTLLGGALVSIPPANVSAGALSDAIAQQQALQAQIDRQKAQISALTASQSKLSGQLASTKATLASVNADLLSVKSQIVDMTVEVAKAQGSVDELEATVALLDAQLADVEAKESAKQAELSDRRAVLAERIRTAYDGDRTSLLETLLSGDNFTDVMSEVDYHLDLAQQDQALAEQIVDDQKLLAVIHQTAVVTKQQTESLRGEAASRKTDLDKQLQDLADAKAQLAALEAQTRELLAAQQAQYAKLAADKTALAKQLADAKAAQDALAAKVRELVRAQYAAGGIPSQYSGSLAWPMPGTITQEFGCTGFGWEPPLQLCPFPLRHRHRQPDVHPDPGRRAGQGDLGRQESVRPVVGGDHRPLVRARDVVRPHRQLGPSARRQRRRIRRPGPDHCLRGHDRLDDRPAPPLGRPAQRRLGQPPPVPLTARRRRRYRRGSARANVPLPGLGATRVVLASRPGRLARRRPAE